MYQEPLVDIGCDYMLTCLGEGSAEGVILNMFSISNNLNISS